MPSEKELCREFNVSRSTMWKAIDELSQAGLIARYRGRGTYICEGVTPEVLERIVTPSFSLITPHQHRLLSAILVRADEAGMELPGIAGNSTMLKVLREKTDRAGHTLLREVNILPPILAAKLRLGSRNYDWTVLELLLSADLPAALMNVTIEPAVLSESDAEVFDAQPGQPTFRYLSRFYSPMGRTIAGTSIFYRPDSYQLSVDLSINDEMLKGGDPSCRETPLAQEMIRSRELS